MKSNPTLKTFDQVLKKASKSHVFRKEYKKELQRLNPTKKVKKVKKVKGWAVILPKYGDIGLAVGEGCILISDYSRRAMLAHAKEIRQKTGIKAKVVPVTISYEI